MVIKWLQGAHAAIIIGLIFKLCPSPYDSYPFKLHSCYLECYSNGISYLNMIFYCLSVRSYHNDIIILYYHFTTCCCSNKLYLKSNKIDYRCFCFKQVCLTKCITRDTVNCIEHQFDYFLCDFANINIWFIKILSLISMLSPSLLDISVHLMKIKGGNTLIGIKGALIVFYGDNTILRERYLPIPKVIFLFYL